jgi:hypothetical protein
MTQICLHVSRRVSRTAAVTLLVVSAACRDAAAPTASTSAEDVVAGSADQLVARGLAVALAQEAQRENLHAALRDSRWMDHKLLLQDYLRTSQGAELAARAAAAVGLSEVAFRAEVAGLPRMDLYLPFREHRLAWRAREEVFVVATRDLDPAQVVAYGPDGGAFALRKADGTPGRALLVLHPAEPRISLARGAMRNRGEAIELPEDAAKGTEAQLLVIPICEPDMIYCEQPCAYDITYCEEPPPPPPPPTPPPPPPPGDYITYFRVTENDGWFGGSMEMEFRSIFGDAPSYCASYTAARNGVNENQATYVNLLLTPASHAFLCLGKRRRITVMEMDGGDFSINDDDFFGQRMNAPNFASPQEIFYNFPMVFSILGSHKADVTIVAK